MIAYIQINSEGTPEFNPLKSLNEIIFISFNKDITAENLIEVEVDGDSGVLGGYYIDGVLYKNTIELESLKTNSKQLIEKHYDSSDYNIVRTKINDTDFQYHNNRAFRALIQEQVNFMQNTVTYDETIDINTLVFQYQYNGSNFIPLNYKTLAKYQYKFLDITNKLFAFKSSLLLEVKNAYEATILDERDFVQEMEDYKNTINFV